MVLEQTLQKMRALKLVEMARSLETRLAKPDHRDLSIAEFVGLVVDDEFMHRQQQKIHSRLSAAKFKERAACMESIDYKASRGITKAQMLELGQLRWIENRQNIAFTGPSGAGKSFLAQALGTEACRHGHRVLYVRLPKLITALLQGRADGSYPKLLKRLERAQVLIIDDLGVCDLKENDRRDFLEILEDRYGVGSTIITTQIPIKDWHEYFGAGRAADSICDRFVHNCHRIELAPKAESQRKLRSNLTDKNLNENHTS